MADYLDKEGLSYFWEKIKAIFATKQDTLVSGTNIKTINNNSLLGSGNIDIQGGGGDVTDVEVNGTSVVDSDGVADVTVPTKTSDLTNDSNFVSDASYVHTDNNFTTTLKNKLDGIEDGAEVNPTYSAVTGKPTGNQTPAFGGTATVSQISQDATGQISATDRTIKIPDSEATTSSHGLMSSGDKTKLNGIESGAEVNVQADWNQTDSSADDYIKNKPPIGDVIAVYQKHESYYTTTQSSESTIPINVSGYRADDILLVDINGLDLVLGSDYSISGNNIVLATPITHSGTVVHFTALRAGSVPSQDLSLLKGDKGDDGVVQDVLQNGVSVLDSNGVANTTDTTYNDATTSASGLMSATDKLKLNNILDLVYPVGSVVTTSSNSNPASVFGGSWSLIDKEYAYKWVSTGFTFNTTNTQEGTFASVIVGHTVELRWTWKNKIAISDDAKPIGTMNMSNIGMSNVHTSYGVITNDALNAVGHARLAWSNGVLTLYVDDWTTRATSYPTTTGQWCYLSVVLVAQGADGMVDSFCNKFYWKRTA